MGNLVLFTGSMFSGKSTALINVIENYDRAGKKILVFNHKLDDDRNEKSTLMTHTGKKIECLSVETIEDIEYIDMSDIQAIFIDEVQFFAKDILMYIMIQCNHTKDLYVSGLDLNWKFQPFKSTQLIMSYADKIYKLKAICDVCKEYKHCISGKKGNNYNTDIVDVGGADKYIPICPQCYNEKLTKIIGEN